MDFNLKFYGIGYHCFRRIKHVTFLIVFHFILNLHHFILINETHNMTAVSGLSIGGCFFPCVPSIYHFVRSHKMDSFRTASFRTVSRYIVIYIFFVLY